MGEGEWGVGGQTEKLSDKESKSEKARRRRRRRTDKSNIFSFQKSVESCPPAGRFLPLLPCLADIVLILSGEWKPRVVRWLRHPEGEGERKGEVGGGVLH